MGRKVGLLALMTALVSGVVAQNGTLASVCTVSYVQSVLPANDFIPGVTLNVDSVTAGAVTNYTVAVSDGMLGGSGYDFCNVTFSYTHTGLNDTVSSPFGQFNILSRLYISCEIVTLTNHVHRSNSGTTFRLQHNGRVGTLLPVDLGMPSRRVHRRSKLDCPMARQREPLTADLAASQLSLRTLCSWPTAHLTRRLSCRSATCQFTR